MTDEVGELVLRDNVLQNLALSMTEQLGPRRCSTPRCGLMRKLEAQGRLDREHRAPAERRRAGRAAQGRPRPDPAGGRRAPGLRQDDALRGPAAHRAARPGLPRRGSSPSTSRARCAGAMRRQIEQHRLKREIVATWIANSVVNRGLDVFVSELEDETGGALEDVLLAYVAARDSFGCCRCGARSRPCRPACRASCRPGCWSAVRDVLVRGTRWFMTQGGRPFRIRDTVARFRPGIDRDHGRSRRRWSARGHAGEPSGGCHSRTARAGSPADLARPMAGLPHAAARLRHRVRGAAGRGRRATRGCSQAARSTSRSTPRSTCPGSRPACGRRRAAGAGIAWR